MILRKNKLKQSKLRVINEQYVVHAFKVPVEKACQTQIAVQAALFVPNGEN
jgi:hypothetical protein